MATLKTKRRNSKGGAKRRKDPLAGLKPEMHPRNRREYIDMDYVKKLTPEEQAYLSKFTDEYYGATLANKDDKSGRRKDLHRTKALRKDCRDRNNRRNRDSISMNRTIQESKETYRRAELPYNKNHEDVVIDLLDVMKDATLKNSKNKTN